MVFSRSFSYLLLLMFAFFSLSARASPYPRMGSPTSVLKLAARVNSLGMKNITATDRARAQALQKRDISDTSIGLANNGLGYTASIGVGNPPTFYTLLVDTGSANTWIGANKPYLPTRTSQDTFQTFKLTYGDGHVVEGDEYLDRMTVKDNLVIDGAYIGVAHNTQLPFGMDGILGLGPARLSEGKVTGFGVIPTVMDGLFAQVPEITSAQFGVFFPPSSTPDNTGELSFGGYDTSKVDGALSEVEITSVPPASRYWGIEQIIYYGDDMILDLAAGIIDTGTTVILIASDAFNDYKARTGAVHDPVTNMLMITLEQYDNLSPLFFNIGGVSYEFSPNAQIWPRALNAAVGGTPDGIYLVISDIGSVAGSGLDVVNGFCFIQRFYVGFNLQTSKIELGKTPFTFATTN